MTVTTYRTASRERAQPPPDRRRRIVLIVAGAVVLAIVATWLVAFSSVFGVRKVVVRGTQVLTTAQVEAAAAITHGTPLVRLDTSAVTRRVEKLPEVESAQVSTSFPSTVVITVEERIAVGYVRRSGRAVLVDGSGVQYRTVATAPPGLPRFAIGSGGHARAIGAAIATVAAALPVSVRKQVTSIEALDRNSITLVLTGGRVVQWGGDARTSDKARLLPVLLRRHATQINVSNPEQPYTR
jgi:cell division protein FtsQ